MPLKKKMKDTDFVTISTRIKSRELSLLDTMTADKLIEAESHDEVVKILTDKGYDTTDAKGAGFLREIIARDRSSVAELVGDAGQGLFDLFLYPSDYLNIKIVLKNEMRDEPANILVSGGSIDAPSLKAAVEARSFDDMTENMKKGIEEAVELSQETANPQFIDIVLDRYCYLDMVEAAQRIGNDYLTGYVKAMIDVANVKSLLRLRRMGKSFDFSSRVFFEGGNTPPERYQEAFPMNDDDMPNVLGKASDLCKKALEAMQGGQGGMAAFELYCDNYLMEYVKKAKYIAFGAEVPTAFLLAKETEYKVLNIIMAGRAAKLEGDTIRERVRALYA